MRQDHFQKRPFGAQIDRSSSLAVGLVFATLPNGGLPADLTTQRMPVLGSGTPVYGAHTEGLWLGGTHSFNYAAQTGLDKITTNGSIFLIGRNPNTSSYGMQVGSVDGISSGNRLFVFGFDNNAVLANNTLIARINEVDYGPGATVLGTNAHLSFHRVGVTYDAATVKFYAFGRQVSSGAISSTPATDVNRRTKFFTNDYDNNGHGNGQNVLTLAWNRTLTGDEMASLYRNPWQIFQPVGPPILYFLQSGASLTHYTITAAQASFTLTGQTANLLEKEVLAAAQASFTLTGQAANLLHKQRIVADQASFTLTGQTVNLLEKEVLTAAQASFTLTGQAAGLKKNVPLVAAQGSFTLTGQAANLLAGHKVAAAQASFTLTGQAIAVARTYRLTAAQASFTLSGQSVVLNEAATLVTAQASFTLTGQAAAFRRTYVAAATQASFTFTGQAASLKAGHKVTADQASFVLTGQNAAFNYLHILAASQASFALTGQAAGLRAQRLITAAFGSYILTGQDATITQVEARTLLAGMGSFVVTFQSGTNLTTTSGGGSGTNRRKARIFDGGWYSNG